MRTIVRNEEIRLRWKRRQQHQRYGAASCRRERLARRHRLIRVYLRPFAIQTVVRKSCDLGQKQIFHSVPSLSLNHLQRNIWDNCPNRLTLLRQTHVKPASRRVKGSPSSSNIKIHRTTPSFTTVPGTGTRTEWATPQMNSGGD